MYEIHVLSSLTYSGSIVNEISINNNNEATTLQAFMIASIVSKYKDVITLLPLQNLTTDYLYDITNFILKPLNDTSFKVLSKISDNTRVNRKMFEKFCGG